MNNNQFVDQELLKTIVQSCDLVELVQSRVHLKKTGSGYVGSCPFHMEKTPSFTVYPRNYYCFGCQEKGNAISFIMKLDSLNFIDAAHVIAQHVGIEIPANTSEKHDEVYDTLKEVATDAHLCMKKMPSIIDTLHARGITDESIKLFEIGYCDTLKLSYETLKNAGLTYKFQKRITFPCRNKNGDYIGMMARATEEGQQPKYINTSENIAFKKSKLVYGLHELGKVGPGALPYIFLVEGPTDVIALKQQGIPAVATMGTSCSSLQLKKIFKFTHKIIACLDGDEAGKKAMERVFKECVHCINEEKQIFFAALPDGLDPDTYINKGGCMQDILHHALSFEDYFRHMLQRQGRDTSKISLAKETCEHIKDIENIYTRNIMLKTMKDWSGVVDMRAFDPFFNKSETRNPSVRKRVIIGLEEKLCYCILQFPEWRDVFYASLQEIARHKEYPLLDVLVESEDDATAIHIFSERYTDFFKRYIHFSQSGEIDIFRSASDLEKEISHLIGQILEVN